MPPCRLYLRPPDGLECRILFLTDGTLDTFQTPLTRSTGLVHGWQAAGIGRDIETPLMERVLAEEMHRGEIQTAATRTTPSRLKNGRFSRQIDEFLALRRSSIPITSNQVPVIRNLPPFPLDRIAQVFLDHAHRRHCIRTQCLNDLQRRHQAILIDFPENGIQFGTCFLQDFRGRSEVSESGGVELGLLGPVFAEGFDGAGGVGGGGV